MRRFLLGLVVFVLYLNQAQAGDSDQSMTVKYDASVEAEFQQDPAVEKKWKKRIYRMFKKGYATGHTAGNSTGFATGHTMGYAIAEGLTFLDTFLCATHGLKGVLEDAYEYTNSKHLPSNSDYEDKEIPTDIYDVMNNNDDWVRRYNYRIDHANIPLLLSTPKNYFDIIMAIKPKSVRTYVSGIQESFIKWYKMLAFKVPRQNVMPGFINDLRNLLIEFKEKNEARYESIDEVYVRFAAHMARSYRMMCALHHQLGNYLKSYAQQHKEMSFLDVLFKFAPTWEMSQEHFEFLNILRQAIPDQLKSLKHVFFEHNGKWIIFPYDNSDDCGRLKIHELPTIPAGMTTYASVVATTTVTTTTANPPIP